MWERENKNGTAREEERDYARDFPLNINGPKQLLGNHFHSDDNNNNVVLIATTQIQTAYIYLAMVIILLFALFEFWRKKKERREVNRILLDWDITYTVHTDISCDAYTAKYDYAHNLMCKSNSIGRNQKKIYEYSIGW